MPQPTANPFQDPSTGMITEASPGPSSWTPTNGFTALPPWTSWSYWRMIHSLEQTLGEPKIRNSVPVSPVLVPVPVPAPNALSDSGTGTGAGTGTVALRT